METKVLQPLQMSALKVQEKNSRKQINYSEIFQKSTAQWGRTRSSRYLVTRKEKSHRPVVLKVSCSSDNTPASVLESRSLPSLLDESEILKKKSEEVEPYLEGRCVYLVGMMGSGKTTVGKVLSEALGYSFYDCDSLIEQAADGISVAEIFKQYGESFFRENETEVLYKLSMMHRLVVSTGGGAVVRPVNWKHMRQGVTVWLDVPLEALARRITAVGTDSRPLLNHGSGDPYSKTMKRLLDLFEERGEAYAKADARVSLEKIATKQGIKDVCDVTPTAIAVEALAQIENFLKRQ